MKEDKDDVRTRVLRTLQEDSNRSSKVMAHEIGISEPSFSKVRVSARQEGVIKRTTAVLDRSKLGFGTVCFFTVHLREQRLADKVASELELWPEVQEVHVLAGSLPLLVKACTRNNPEMSGVQDRIRDLPDVRTAYGEIVMQTYRETLDVPI